MSDDMLNASRRRFLTVVSASTASALFATQKIGAEDLIGQTVPHLLLGAKVPKT